MTLGSFERIQKINTTRGPKEAKDLVVCNYSLGCFSFEWRHLPAAQTLTSCPSPFQSDLQKDTEGERENQQKGQMGKLFNNGSKMQAIFDICVHVHLVPDAFQMFAASRRAQKHIHSPNLKVLLFKKKQVSHGHAIQANNWHNMMNVWEKKNKRRMRKKRKWLHSEDNISPS